MKKVIILIVFFCVLFTYKTLCFAQKEALNGTLELFVQANLAYKEAKYDEAILGYEGILAKGVENGNVYYNLGNSYFKKGALGKALLNYERARFFMPNDSDLRANYEYVLSLSDLAFDRSGGFWITRLIDKLFSGANCNFIAFMLSACYYLLVLIVILWLLFPPRARLYKLLAAPIFVIFILAMIAFNRKLDYFNNSAVVISKEVEVKFGPLQDATNFFNLSEGSKVRTLEQTFDWVKIRRFDGKVGWVVKSKVERLF